MKKTTFPLPKFFVISVLFFTCIPALGQSDNKAEIIEIIEIVDDNSNGRPSSSTVNTFDYKPDEDGVYNVAETMPEFPGGTRALLDWLDKNIVYPDFCLKNKIQGRVMVSFVVDKDGSILSPEVLKGIFASLDKEAVRLVSSMPKWKPGKVKNEPVKVRYTIPVNFRLPDTNSSNSDNTTSNPEGQTAKGGETMVFTIVEDDIPSKSEDLADIPIHEIIVIEDDKPYEDNCVDLGLEVLWGTCNIGANSPEESGNYYAFGEIEPKESYGWNNYKWCEGSETTLTRYNGDPQRGTVDNPNRLKSEDDVASSTFGELWHIPTESEWKELIECCTWTLVTGESGYGYKVTSKLPGYTDKSIYLPASGVRNGTNLTGLSNGFYWSSTTGSQSAQGGSKAMILAFTNSAKTMAMSGYMNGLTVRPVRERNEDDEPLFIIVEKVPEFPGGSEALLQFLRMNVKYPASCREKNIQGRVIVSFVVDKDGSISQIEVEKSVHPLLDAEAIRVISIMPKWNPGTQRGKPVRVKYSVPITFRLG